MTVRLNKWNGERFENDTTCVYCGNLASVVELEVFCAYYGLHVFKLCKSCLLKFANEIDQAILEDVMAKARTT